MKDAALLTVLDYFINEFTTTDFIIRVFGWVCLSIISCFRYNILGLVVLQRFTKRFFINVYYGLITKLFFSMFNNLFFL